MDLSLYTGILMYIMCWLVVPSPNHHIVDWIWQNKLTVPRNIKCGTKPCGLQHRISNIEYEILALGSLVDTCAC